MGTNTDIDMEQLVKDIRSQRWTSDYKEGVETLRDLCRERAAQKRTRESLKATIEALEGILAKFEPRHKASLELWEGSGTECFEDSEWQEAATLTPVAKIAEAALETARKALEGME